MTSWTSSDVARALELGGPDAGAVFTSISTDTRTLEPGALFVALRGPRFDGHGFLDVAKGRKAAGAVIERGTDCPPGLIAFEVDDTLKALGRLARWRRRHVDGPVVAITGTNGKTSTKEMVARVLETQWRTHATLANRNNLIGVPLTILEAPGTTQALVVEAGASVPGEVARLREIIRPSLGIVTNVSPGHVEGFGSLAGVMQEKVSLLADVDHAVVGTEPPELRDAAAAVTPRVTVAGSQPHADIAPTAVTLRADGCAELEFSDRLITLPVAGRHQVENAMLALAVAHVLDLTLDRVVPALERVEIPGGRCRVVEIGGVTLLDDTYNANPASVEAALETAVSMAQGRAIVVGLGSMLELGEEGPRLHREIASLVVKAQPSLIAVTGDFVSAFDRWADALGDRLIEAPDAATLGRRVRQHLRGGELILLKASRGVHLERAIPHITGDGGI